MSTKSKINHEELFLEAMDRLLDVLEGDDGQAWKEAEQFVKKASEITGKTFKLGGDYHVDDRQDHSSSGEDT